MPDPALGLQSHMDAHRNAQPDAHRDAQPDAHPLSATWRHGLSIVNLRGAADDAGFAAAAQQALGLALPLAPCSTRAGAAAAGGATHDRAVERIVWAGPDDWFIVAAAGQAGAIEHDLRASLTGLHHAVTDVSSGYSVLRLSGRPVREVLAQGCPLDLHARAFGVGQSAGSHFFKASVWLWQTDAAPQFELLVRRSFTGYVRLMLQRCTLECGLVED